MNTLIVERVVEQLRVLPYELQWRVFEFTRALNLSAPHGVSGQQMLSLSGAIQADDLRLMAEAIEAGCEKVDADERMPFA